MRCGYWACLYRFSNVSLQQEQWDHPPPPPASPEHPCFHIHSFATSPTVAAMWSRFPTVKDRCGFPEREVTGKRITMSLKEALFQHFQFQSTHTHSNDLNTDWQHYHKMQADEDLATNLTEKIQILARSTSSMSQHPASKTHARKAFHCTPPRCLRPCVFLFPAAFFSFLVFWVTQANLLWQLCSSMWVSPWCECALSNDWLVLKGYFCLELLTVMVNWSLKFLWGGGSGVLVDIWEYAQ